MKTSLKFGWHRLVYALAIGCASTGASAQSLGSTLTPNQPFPSDVLTIHSPNSEGWLITGHGENGITFGKFGPGKNESYAAQAILIEMPATSSDSELLDFVVKRVAALNPPPRFIEHSATYQFTTQRGYPCVDVRIRFDDKGAAAPIGLKPAKLQVIASYCRHPTQNGIGFMAAYSHKGPHWIADLEVGAHDYLNGITVPDRSPPPRKSGEP